MKMMDKLSQLWRRLVFYTRRDRFDRELEEEMRFHLEMKAEENLAAGTSQEEARYAAQRQFGNQTLLREVSRDMWGFRFLETLFQDLRFGVRMLRKNPGFTLIAAITLALGIGANTAIFSLLNATLLRPLPYQNPNQIVMVWGTNRGGFGWRGKTGLSALNFLDYQQQNHVFAHMATFNGADFTLTGVDNPERIRGGRVNAEFFQTLAVQPLLGRLFQPNDEQAGGDHVVVLSYGLWQRRWAADPKLIGQTIRLNEEPYTVVGVLPQSFDFSIPEFFAARDLWTPTVIPRNDRRSHNFLNAIARLKPGVTLSQAQTDLDTITERLQRAYPREVSGSGTLLVPLREQVVGDIRPVVWLLFGAVSFVLLIACANVANLQLARASTRQKEIALRMAVGASRGRVLRQLLTESALLAVLGGALGVLLAAWGIRLLTGLSLAGLPQGTRVPIDSTALAYSLLLSLGAGILFGLAPALQAAPTQLNEALKESGKSSSAGDRGARLRNLLTVSEVALSMILLIGAGLLIRSFAGLVRVNPGFETKNILAVSFNLPRYAYPDAAKQAAFYAQLMERVRALPEVTAVGATNDLPPTKSSDSDGISIEGQGYVGRSSKESEDLAVQDRLATPDYFRVMGIPLVAGRAFSEAETNLSPPEVIVNQTFARRFFPNENPLGRHLKFGEMSSANPWLTIIGVVGDVRGFGLDKQPNSEIYLSYQQQSFLPYNPLPRLSLVVRARSDPNDVAASVLGAVRELDKGLPLPPAQTMETVLAASIAERRANMLMLGVFALLAVGLAGVGIYGVISYAVAQQTHEIGVRVALGAQSRDVLALVVGNGMRLALIGIVIGLLGAAALTRWMRSLLFGVTPTDAVTFIVVAAALLVVALVACYAPARRATKVDPMTALRFD